MQVVLASARRSAYSGESISAPQLGHAVFKLRCPQTPPRNYQSKRPRCYLDTRSSAARTMTEIGLFSTNRSNTRL